MGVVGTDPSCLTIGSFKSQFSNIFHMYVCIYCAVSMHKVQHYNQLRLNMKCTTSRQVVGYLTQCNVVLQIKHLSIYFGENVSNEQVFTILSLP